MRPGGAGIYDYRECGKADFTTQNRAASDAAFTLNNLSFSRASNEVQDVLPGVTLSLRASPLTSACEREPRRVRKRTSRPDAYNVAETNLNELTDPDSVEGGVLLGTALSACTADLEHHGRTGKFQPRGW